MFLRLVLSSRGGKPSVADWRALYLGTGDSCWQHNNAGSPTSKAEEAILPRGEGIGPDRQTGPIQTVNRVYSRLVILSSSHTINRPYFPPPLYKATVSIALSLLYTP